MKLKLLLGVFLLLGSFKSIAKNYNSFDELRHYHNSLSLDTIKNTNNKQAFAETISNLNKKIIKLQKEKKEAESKEKSFFGKLTEEMTANFREQKLNYLIGLRDFLVSRGSNINDIGSGVKKMLED